MFDPMTMQWLLQTLGPDGAAQTLAGAGIEPPSLPIAGVSEAMNDVTGESLGQELNPVDTISGRWPQRSEQFGELLKPIQNVPLPTPRPMGLGESIDASSTTPSVHLPGPAAAPVAPLGEKELTMDNPLVKALRGVQVPKPPEPVKPSSPSAPRPSAAIKPGDLLNMLLMLNQGGGAQAKAPPTLGAALSGRG